MESPRSVHRFLLTLCAVFTVAAVVASFHYREPLITAGWLLGVALFFVFGFCMAVLNFIFIVPILWTIGKLASPRTPAKATSPASGDPCA